MTRGRQATLIAVVAAAAFAAGLGAMRWFVDSPPAGGPAAGPAVPAEREILYWVAPMDKNYRRDKPGKSPMGMDLVPVYADAAPPEDEDVVVIDPAVVQNLGVRTTTAERGVLPRRIETVGYVQYDENTMQHVHTRVEGWIESLGVQAAGDPVVEGQVLFEIYSPTLVNAQREYVAARTQGDRELQAASEERLAALGLPAEQIAELAKGGEPRQRVRVLARHAGVTTHLGVREGIFVTPATHVLSIANLSRVWVHAEVFERHAAWVKTGQPAEVELEHRPGERWQGTVDYIYPELDPQTRSLKVRIAFANPVRTLRPNMFARVTLRSADPEPVVHIPRQALIRGGEFDRVAVSLGNGRFRSVRVVAGIEAGDRVEVRAGLKAGARVVISGQFLIDSESNLATALARADATGDAEGEAPASGGGHHQHH